MGSEGFGPIKETVVQRLQNHCPSLPRCRQLALLALLIAYGSLFLNAKAFWGNHPESRRAQIASEFLEPGHCLLVPTLMGNPIMTKPPLFYWMQAACMKVLGRNEAAARLPSVLLGAICLLAVYATGCRWRNPTTGFFSVGILVSSPMFLIYFRTAELDMGLCAAIAVACHCLYRAAFEEDYRPGWAAGFWITMTLGFMLKGPYALFPLIALGAWMFADHSRRFRRVAFSPGFVFFLLITGGYYLYILKTVPEAATILRAETIGRFGTHTVHQRPFYYYIPSLLMFGFWVPFVGPAMRQAWRCKDRYSRYLFVLCLGILMVLSIIKSKKGQYILPTFPILALLVGAWLDRLNSQWSDSGQRPRNKISTYLAWVSRILIALVWTISAYVFHLDHSHISGMLALLFLSLAATAFLVSSQRNANASLQGMPMQVCGILTIMLLVNGMALPALNTQHTIRPFARQASKLVPVGAELYAFRIENYSLPFYSARKTIFVEGDLPPEARFVVTRADKLEELNQYGPWHAALSSDNLFPEETVPNKYDYVLYQPGPAPGTGNI